VRCDGWFQGQHWLPARKIDLAQQISDAQELRVGEPVTRTVILDAVGLDEHMLEEPAWPEIVSARIYPDQPQGISRDNGEWVLGHREFRYAVVPEQAGELVLPEIRLAWWDTVADQQRVAVLPEHRVRVLPAEQQAGATVGPPAQPGQAGLPGTGQVGGSVARWQLLSLALAALWLLTLVLYLRGGRSPRSPRASDNDSAAMAEKDVLNSLQAACRGGDAVAARRQLGRWLRHHGPAGARGSALGLAGLVEEPLAGCLRSLDAQGFTPQLAGQWDGAALWQAFAAWRKATASAPGSSDSHQEDIYTTAKRIRAG
jgi:hypothetical protein